MLTSPVMPSALPTSRSNQSLRQRRESARPSISRISTRASTVEALETPMPMDPLPLVKTEQSVLKRHQRSPPSFIVHLYPNHFRLHQINENFTYDSPMADLIKHIKNREIPHDFLEALYESGVPWYDGSLIVQVHDHRSSTGTASSTATNQVGGSFLTPFSIHNHNEHITPSPHLKAADKIKELMVSEQKNAAKADQAATNKENMAAPEQPASALKGSKQAKVFTVVLFQTQMSIEKDLEILSRTPLKDFARRQNGLLNGYPPSTPLTALPPTPGAARGALSTTKMSVDQTNVRELEAAILLAENPVLYLEPAKNADEMFNIHEMLRDPLHNQAAPKAKAKKRTVAQVAADEAQAEKEQRFILSLDDAHSTSATGANTTRGGAASAEGQAGPAPKHDFKRLKVLETIKMSFQKAEQERKEREARSLHAKNQQIAAEEARKREIQAKVQQQQLAQQNARENVERQMQIQMAQRNAAAMNGMANGQLMKAQSVVGGHGHPTTSAGQAHSPILRQQTPMASSPVGEGIGMSSVGMAGTPMATSLSNQGLSSPAVRPQSANMQHPNGMPMARQISQQHNQRPGSAMGTPQMQNTPHMTNAGPARHLTPQPRMAGSPIPGQLQAQAMMMTPSQQQQLPPDQMALLRARQLQMGQRPPQMNAQAMQGMAGLTPQQQMTMLQMQQRQMQMQQQQQNPAMQQVQTPNGGISAAAMAQRTIVPVLNQFEVKSRQMITRFVQQFPNLGQAAQEQETARQNAINTFKAQSEQRRVMFVSSRNGEPAPNEWTAFYANEARQCNATMSGFITKSQQMLAAHANNFRQRQLAQQQQLQAQQQQQQQQVQSQQGLSQQTQQQMQHMMNGGMSQANAAQMIQAMHQARNQGGNPIPNDAARQYLMQLQNQKMLMQQRGMMNLQQQQNMQGMQGMAGMNGMMGQNPQINMGQMQQMPNAHQLQQMQQMQQMMHMQNMNQNQNQMQGGHGM